MSTTSIASLPVRSAYSADVAISAAPVAGPRGEVRVRTIFASGTPSQASRSELKGLRLKRRLKGFVTEAHGENWKVLFVINGEQVPYELPSKELKHAKIEERYQPFEMDEFVPSAPGLAGKLYKFRPLAKTAAAALETLELDPEQTKKRDLILGRSKKA